MDHQYPSKTDLQGNPPESSPAAAGMQPETNPGYAYQENKRDYKHSGPGIASFVIALVTVVGYAISFVYAGMQATSILSSSNDVINDSSQTIMLLGLTVLILAAVNVAGAVVGIIGLTLRRRKKVFAIIGTVINALILLLFMLMIATVLVNAGA
ncbi:MULTISPECIES: hypothetical protein [unclassified Paenibacillus]|uniref:hypothetical protein n=1 Tax=unclassified Paenibacillus TaxID=185978 RepID=UPI002406E960|nr:MULTISPECIES: hypothetical protein [unclassified Paenibacillus]MDF9841811.1 hypothetical protein [Paenibacillus sp. PastF-2]MDF9848508.1 hypothetical protein [Paenibacillus sp. PastM-2]MDF9854971.1 hypothetical protein [Paenibacillus sp. PastF-1]MDH6480240.1 hypothetical protein [Paenibacillus sp. PastH-2]MDH6507776.1 hypothetical protein [Paenibacillus sp. PastM-3]